MITISEGSCTKLSGISSLYISFDFNVQIVNIIKATERYIYDNKNHIWEVPATSLKELLDNLTYVDDITLTLLKDDSSKEHLTPKLIPKYKSKPFKHQMEGIEFGINHPSWLLLDEPGLGKTLQSIYIAEELKEQKGLEHCLIICGINSLKENWESEVNKHSNESVRILGKKVSKNGKVTYGTIKERVEEIMNPLKEFFIITNIESIRNDDMIQALRTTKNKIGMIIFDEAHRCLVGNSLIETDEGFKSISEIVDNELKCKIKSFNIEKGCIEYKDIDSYYKSEDKQKLIKLNIIDENNQMHSLTCTPDHPIYTKNRGYVNAEDLTEFDELILE